jgi:excisionase family DNA binding protein
MREEHTDFLTTRQLARMWQVSEATVKRWADAGRLHPSRTLGGHRRFALSEVLRFQNEQGLEITQRARHMAGKAGAQEKGVVATDAQGGVEQFFDAISRGQEGASAGVLLSAYMSGLPLIKILDVMVTESMRRLGNLWHCGEVTVADEHLATRTALRAVETLRGCIRKEAADGRRAVVCAVEEEMHELAALCVQLLLEEKGWSVLNMGAHTPFYAMADALEKHRPSLVCISSTSNLALSRNAREYDQFRALASKRNVQVALGGEGFRDELIRQRFPADLHAGSFKDLADFLQA